MKKTNGVKFTIEVDEHTEGTQIPMEAYKELDSRTPKPVTINLNSESVWVPKDIQKAKDRINYMTDKKP